MNLWSAFALLGGLTFSKGFFVGPPPSLLTRSVGPLFSIDEGLLKEHLEERIDRLATLAVKFSDIPALEDIADLHVRKVNGDKMSIEVVYCDAADNTCVALDIPLSFPRHCDTEEEVFSMLTDLEELDCEDTENGEACRLVSEGGPGDEDEDVAGHGIEISLALAATIQRLEQVLVTDFQDELESWWEHHGGKKHSEGDLQLVNLSPRGFELLSSDGEEKVSIKFKKLCQSGVDFQAAMLELTERCVRYS